MRLGVLFAGGLERIARTRQIANASRRATGAEIKTLREREEVSQTVLAHYLKMTKDSISQWERGQKQPAGASLKLLSLVDRKRLDAIA